MIWCASSVIWYQAFTMRGPRVTGWSISMPTVSKRLILGEGVSRGEAKVRFNRWRLFVMACEELFASIMAASGRSFIS